jgi:hypothetical protein
MPTHVWLGNHQAVEVTRDDKDQLVRTPLDGKRCTTVAIPDGRPLAEAITEITHQQGVWAYHSDATKPAWVASDNPLLAEVLAAHYGCELRTPDPAPEV